MDVFLHFHHVRKKAIGIHEHLSQKHAHKSVVWLFQAEVEKNVVGQGAMHRPLPPARNG